MAIIPVENVLSSSNLILFFSLPFRPVGKITLYDREAFSLHRYCIGLWGDPQKKMDRWIDAEAS